MSLYPSPGNWQEMNRQCNANMIDMVSRYGSEVIICEIGMSWDSPNESKAFLTDIISRNRKQKRAKVRESFFGNLNAMVDGKATLLVPLTIQVSQQ